MRFVVTHNPLIRFSLIEYPYEDRDPAWEARNGGNPG